ncbi:MAG: hypothetical protein HXY38_10905 [Chloroflexi bacterium]|nr:hypothetical protein [Chloroflexota bacterium]
MLKKLFLVTTFVLFLAACLPSASATEDVQEQVNTAVAGTMLVNEQIDLAVEQTVAAGEAAASTEESANLDEVALQATNTLEPTVTPFVAATFTPTATPIPLKYTCAVYKKKPKDNETFSKNEEFDVKFTITNTGTRIWPKGVDFKYVGGTDLASPNRVEIPVALQPGQSYEVTLDGQAPDKKGFYVMTYFVDGPMCYGYIAINVK